MTVDMGIEYLARGLDWLAEKMHDLVAKVFLMPTEQRSYLNMLLIVGGFYLFLSAAKRMRKVVKI